MKIEDFLGQRGTVHVLKALDQEKGELMLTKLFKRTPVSQKAFYRAIKTLLNLRLIVERNPEIHNVRLFKISERGQSVVRILKQIEGIMRK